MQIRLEQIGIQYYNNIIMKSGLCTFYSMDTMCILCIVHALQYMHKIADILWVYHTTCGIMGGGGGGKGREGGIKATITNNYLILNPSVFILFVVFT